MRRAAETALPPPPQVACYIVRGSSARPFGISTGERIRRSLARIGIAMVADHPQLMPRMPQILVIRGDYVYDPEVVIGLARTPGAAMPDSNGKIVAAHVLAADAPAVIKALNDDAAMPEGLATPLAVMGPAEVAGSYRNALRKRAPPVVEPISMATMAAVERKLFDASYKGVTDLVTKYVWPRPAFHVTRRLAHLHVKPNPVTWVSLVFVVLAFGFFGMGWFIPGLACAWMMCFLDTVDGKLARCTVASSKFGDWFDHGIDLIHPPFWYWAWVSGLGKAHITHTYEYELLAVVVGGYLIGRLQEGLFLWWFKIEMHVWRRFDSLFRLVTARRNPNLLLLTAGALVGRPDWGFVAVAAWTLVSIAVHTLRILWAGVVRLAAGKGAMRSWLADPERAG